MSHRGEIQLGVQILWDNFISLCLAESQTTNIIPPVFPKFLFSLSKCITFPDVGHIAEQTSAVQMKLTNRLFVHVHLIPRPFSLSLPSILLASPFPPSLSRCLGGRGNCYDSVQGIEEWKWAGSHCAFSLGIVAAWNRIINAILSCICS